MLTTCLSVLEERFLFLGSRLGNSLLLQFTEKELGSVFAGSTSRDELYENRSSRKTNSQQEKGSYGSPILLIIVSENRFSGKTYFYAIASRGLAAAASGLEPPAKKKKVADSGDLDWMASDVADIRDIDLEVRHHFSGE